MEYLVEGRRFVLSYQELKEQYTAHCAMSDSDFLQNLPTAIHLACVICFLKEIPAYMCLSDRGIIHELSHLLHIPRDTSIKDVRQLFQEQLKLV